MKVKSTACASKTIKTNHHRAFCATHRLLSHPQLMCASSMHTPTVAWYKNQPVALLNMPVRSALMNCNVKFIFVLSNSKKSTKKPCGQPKAAERCVRIIFCYLR